MFGIHGGAEWPGGTYDKLNNQIILPTNHYPWIIRTFYTEKKKKTFLKNLNLDDLNFMGKDKIILL